MTPGRPAPPPERNAPTDGPTLLPLPILEDAGGCGAGDAGGDDSPCDDCHGGCCRSFAVPVTGADVFRLTRATGRDFWEVACRWPDPDGRIARRFAPALFFSDDSPADGAVDAAGPVAPGEPSVLCLTHQASATLPGSTRCRFLVETPPTAERPRGLGRCGVYGQRPAACRSFPLQFAADGHLVKIHHVPARGRSGAHPAYDLCPRPWTAEDVDPLTAPGDLAAARWEMDFFRRAAAVWNRAPRPSSAFPAFLEAIYAGRVADGDAAEAARRRAA